MYKVQDESTLEGSYYTPNGYILALVDRESSPDYNNALMYSDLPFFMRRDQTARKAKAYLNPIYQNDSKQINEHTIYYLPHMDKVIILSQNEQYSLVAIHPDIIVAIVPGEYTENTSSSIAPETETREEQQIETREEQQEENETKLK